MLVGFEDNRSALAWQVQQLIREVSPEYAPGLDVRAGPTTEPLWRALGDSPARTDSRLTFKANLLPSRTATFCDHLTQMPYEISLHAHAGNGIVRGHVDGASTLERAEALVRRLQELTAPEGNVIVERCPTQWKTSLPVWGIRRGDASLMHTIKKALDPGNLFNPGRLIDALEPRDKPL